MGNLSQHDLRCDHHSTGVKTHGWCNSWKSRDQQQPCPVQLQVNQTGAWRSTLDFDLVEAPPELLSTADQLARLTAHDRIRMRIVMCKASDNGSHVATRNVLMHWSRPEGWVNT
jgi:hypothetical protein